MAKDSNPIQAMKPFQIPTPKLGDTVLWYAKGDKSHGGYAAIVTEIETVGRVKLTIFPPSGIPRVAQNVNFVDMPKSFRNEQSRLYDQYGGWCWQSKHVPGGAYDLWNEREKQREAAEAEAKRQREEADRKASEEVAVTATV